MHLLLHNSRQHCDGEFLSLTIRLLALREVQGLARDSSSLGWGQHWDGTIPPAICKASVQTFLRISHLPFCLASFFPRFLPPAIRSLLDGVLGAHDVLGEKLFVNLNPWDRWEGAVVSEG